MSIKFKIQFFQLIAKILLKQRNLNKFRHWLIGHIQSWHFFYQKILKYFNDFQNRNFSVLWLKWTQTMEMKQNHAFFCRTYLNLTSFLIGHKILKYFHDFYNWLFQSHSKSEHKQIKWNKMKQHMCISDIIFHYVKQNSTLFKWHLKPSLAKVYVKNEW